jgi:plasmid stabilization system protein ParE
VPLIVLHSRAKAYLSEIWEFIADDIDEYSDTFIDLIDQKLQLLAQQTGLGRLRGDQA